MNGYNFDKIIYDEIMTHKFTLKLSNKLTGVIASS